MAVGVVARPDSRPRARAGEVVGDLGLGDLAGPQPDDGEHAEDPEPKPAPMVLDPRTIETANTPTLTPKKATTRSRRLVAWEVDRECQHPMATRSIVIMIMEFVPVPASVDDDLLIVSSGPLRFL